MPGLAQRINNNDNNLSYLNPLMGHANSFNGSSVSSNGFWSKHPDDVSYNQLQKFWCELTPQARQDLLRIDKQTLFEHARKNMYCSRCNGLLLEGFLQIVMYGKSLQQDASGVHYSVRDTVNQNDVDFCTGSGCHDDAQDPSVHPWGGLTTVRDGTLTLMDCYIHSKSLRRLQNVFDSGRARERERELLYPDACGGGGRGWISQGITGYGRGHGTRETCALHTARLSVETLVDFWSALGEETRQSLLRMKEEDFIERLMYRFDSKRFCRDCRRNVIREFKELKELKRMRKEPRCTSWFCVADTAFQYEVSRDTVQADWHKTFSDAFGTYHHFEWAIGTGEGKSDILEFENVGLSARVQVNGLDLSGLNACYITLRAWKRDGRCNELFVKAHALRGQQCVHCRLVVGDGFVTITRGQSITRFFEHAEEAEEEEDDDPMDKDGNELDGECSRPQKHAKSPELAREFLLDAATVVFKEQVEKAFREGTARQNAHSIFVCLALKLLEERIHVACKEIITLEKQMKLLEEEEKEKRDEEERKERRRTKEREKKLRRKERLREKENREKKCAESNVDPTVSDVSKEESTPCNDEISNIVDSVSETGEATPSSPLSPDIQDDQLLTEYIFSNMQNHSENVADEDGNSSDWIPSFPYDHHNTHSRRKQKFHKHLLRDMKLTWPDRRKGSALSDHGVKLEPRYHGDGFECIRSINGFNKPLRTSTGKPNIRNGGTKLNEKFTCTNYRIIDRYDPHVCSCKHHNKYRSRPEPNITRIVGESKYVNKLESPADISKPYYRGKYIQVDCAREINGRPKIKMIAGNSPNTKKVWEPLDSKRKYVRSNSDSDVTLRSTPLVETCESDRPHESSGSTSCDEVAYISVQNNHVDNDMSELTRIGDEDCGNRDDGLHPIAKSEKYSKDEVAEDVELCSMPRFPKRASNELCFMSSSSNSDNCSSCLSEGDCNSNPQNVESTSTSDSEESSQHSEGRETSHRVENKFTECHGTVDNLSTWRGQDAKSQGPASAGTISLVSLSKEAAPYIDNGKANVSIGVMSENVLPQMHNRNIHYPVFPTPTMGYYHQSPVSWPAGPTNGLMSFPHSNHYLFANTYGYGLNGNARFMQYGLVQHLAPPVLSHGHLPIFHPVSQVNGVSTEETTKLANIAGSHKIQKVVSTDQDSSTVVGAGQNRKSDKMDKGNSDFSLFHFGGPVALSTGFKADPVSLNGENTCNKKDTIEEYNLFDASNGIKFSIF